MSDLLFYLQLFHLNIFQSIQGLLFWFSKLGKSNINIDRHVYKDWFIHEYSKTALHATCEKEYLEIFQLLTSCKNVEVNEKLKGSW